MEPRVVELDDLLQRGRRAVVEVGRPRGQPTQRRAFELTDVGPFAGKKRAARIGGVDERAGGMVAQGIERQVRRAPARVRYADVQRYGQGMVADVGRVVTGGAGSYYLLWAAEVGIVVEALNAGNANGLADK